MKGSVPNAYFGKSDKGWVNTQLFYKWLEEHYFYKTQGNNQATSVIN